jgi:hypothetical protein
MPSQKTAKERKERRRLEKSQFVIMTLIPCQVSFNIEERAHFVYTKRKNRTRKRREEERMRESRES